MQIKLSSQEEQAMQIIWKLGETNIKTVHDQIGDSFLPYTTLASTMRKLQRMGYLKSRLVSNVHLYQATISESAYKKKFMNGFVADYFDSSYKKLVNFFVEQKKLKPEELKEIIDLIGDEKQEEIPD
ncbi:MAG: BlaI/MecI/CopY family transcriptional regulator [Dinghuibacter sp.]|nr:BlaI/MecI/CopY family transcriptional regulator [Dinghuibacter sp.]